MLTLTRIGSRGTACTFGDDITVYAIETPTRWFLCDTHLGPQSMAAIRQQVIGQAPHKEVVIFNSHSDWDHVWGNCAFSEGTIIAHEACRTRLQDIGAWECQQLHQHQQGAVHIVLPNLTFRDTLVLAEENIAFIHMPGHTIDSAVCFDRQDQVLFVGDLVEDPIPYLDWDNLAVYEMTLQRIKDFPAAVKLSAHSGIINEALLERNMAYVKAMRLGHTVAAEVYAGYEEVHVFNVNNRLLLAAEQVARTKLGDTFNYRLFRQQFPDIKGVEYTSLQQQLAAYVAKL